MNEYERGFADGHKCCQARREKLELEVKQAYRDGVEAAARAVLEAKMEFKNAAGRGTTIVDYAVEGQSFKKHAARAIRALVTVQEGDK